MSGRRSYSPRQGGLFQCVMAEQHDGRQSAPGAVMPASVDDAAVPTAMPTPMPITSAARGRSAPDQHDEHGQVSR